MAHPFVKSGKLKADPIAVYFSSQEERDAVIEYARLTKRSSSNLFKTAVEDFMKVNPIGDKKL